MPAEMVTYEWFASNYHFSEEMTDSLSAEALEWFPLIRAARAHAQEAQQSQSARVEALTQNAHNKQGTIPFTQGMRTPGSG